ncbi:MAG: hypothetical protein KA980_12915, partial [Flavobacterium sp.]
MPANFPEIWLERVTQTLESGDTADFLDGVQEIDGDVTEMGEENLIHVPLTEFSPDILINNKTYPIAVQEYTDDEVILKLDKYQTKATKVTDDQVIGASYPRIDAVTKSHTNKINTTKYKKALHAIAPDGDKTKTPVLELAGAECTYEDLVALKDKLDSLEWPEEGRRLVLCTKHWNHLLKDRKNFGDQLINYKKGEVAPIIAGFEIKKYISAPHYNNKVKKVFGEVPAVGDKPASIAFIVDNVKKKNGSTKQYF